MDRGATDKIIINSVYRMDIGYLRENGVIVQGKQLTGTIQVNSDIGFGFESNLTVKDQYIRFAYTYKGKEKNYHIFLNSIPSNLGKGRIYYFICPVNGSRCRKLYFCNESGIWQSRTAFKTRLYYSYQLSSKYNYNNDRYWVLDKQLKNLYTRVVKSHYRGYLTRLQLRIRRMEKKKEYFDKLRWTKVPKGIQKMFDEVKMVQ